MINWIEGLLKGSTWRKVNRALEKENQLKLKVAFLPIEEQAKYVDDLGEMIGDYALTKEALGDLDAPEDYSVYNTTSIGNLAYIALYSPFQEYKDHAYSRLKGFKEYIQHSN